MMLLPEAGRKNSADLVIEERETGAATSTPNPSYCHPYATNTFHDHEHVLLSYRYPFSR